MTTQIPRAIHRLFYDRLFPSVLPTSWTVEPHEVILRDRRGDAGCPRPGWIVRAYYDGFADPAVRYVTLDWYGTGMDYSPLPDPHPQPFEIGPQRRHDSGWWRHLRVTRPNGICLLRLCNSQRCRGWHSNRTTHHTTPAAFAGALIEHQQESSVSRSGDEQIRQLQKIIGGGKIERLPDGRVKMTFGGRTVYGLDPQHCVEMAWHLAAVQAQSLAYDHAAIPDVIGDIVEQGNEIRRHGHYSLRTWWCDYREVAHWAVLQWDGSEWMMLAMGFCRNIQDAHRIGLAVWVFTPKTTEDCP